MSSCTWPPRPGVLLPGGSMYALPIEGAAKRKGKKGTFFFSSNDCLPGSRQEVGVQTVPANVHSSGDGSQGPVMSTSITLFLLYCSSHALSPAVCVSVSWHPPLHFWFLYFSLSLREGGCLLSFHLCYILQFFHVFWLLIIFCLVNSSLYLMSHVQFINRACLLVIPRRDMPSDWCTVVCICPLPALCSWLIG